MLKALTGLGGAIPRIWLVYSAYIVRRIPRAYTGQFREAMWGDSAWITLALHRIVHNHYTYLSATCPCTVLEGAKVAAANHP